MCWRLGKRRCEGRGGPSRVEGYKNFPLGVAVQGDGVLRGLWSTKAFARVAVGGQTRKGGVKKDTRSERVGT